MLKNKKGYMGLVAILVIVVIFLAWFAYLWNKNWFGGGIKVPSLSTQNENGQQENSSTATPANPGDINNQLNTLRTDVKNLQDKKDQEIFNELNKK